LGIAIKKQSFAVVEKILKLIHVEDRCKLNEDDSKQLLNYKSGLVKDALNQIFTKSVFNDKVPMMGIIKKQGFFGKAKIYYFDTEYTPNLNYGEVKLQTLK
tara:strand:- start:66 stop:368 length:303 start_codon:yes stop_codon:yes gene_type:complete